MKRFILAINIVILFMSCATSIKLTDTVRTDSQYYIIPEIGTQATVYIGEPLIKEGRSSAQDAIILNNDNGTAGVTAFHPAGIYKMIGKKKDTFVYQHRMIMPGMIGTVYPQIIEEPDGKVYLVLLNNNKKLLNSSEYSKRKVVEETGDDFEQTLIYTGAEGTVLKFSYREFSNNMARAAFTVDATYDIRTDKVIRFRGALLEIIKVDNQSITYKVLSGFQSGR